MVSSFNDLMTDTVEYYSIGETSTSTGVEYLETLVLTVKGVVYSTKQNKKFIGDQFQAEADFIVVHDPALITVTLKDSYKATLTNNGLSYKITYIEDTGLQGAGTVIYLKEDTRSNG